MWWKILIAVGTLGFLFVLWCIFNVSSRASRREEQEMMEESFNSNPQIIKTKNENDT